MTMGVRLVVPKRHVAYRREKSLFRAMVSECVPARWAQLMIVDDDAVYGAKANMRRVQDWDKADRVHRWGCAFAIARTWKTTVEDQTLNNLVAHVPPKYYQRTQVPRETAGTGRRTFWTSRTLLGMRHVGDVTLVLGKKRRHVHVGSDLACVAATGYNEPSRV